MNVNNALFTAFHLKSLHYGKNKLHIDEMIMMDFYSASSQSAGRHVASLASIILITRQTVSLLLLLNAACLEQKQQIPILQVFG
jgi:hypothetical protein